MGEIMFGESPCIFLQLTSIYLIIIINLFKIMVLVVIIIIIIESSFIDPIRFYLRNWVVILYWIPFQIELNNDIL
jgi:hypothetical protein